MRARIMPFITRLFAALALMLAGIVAVPGQAQTAGGRANNLGAELVAEHAARPGEKVTLAIVFTPRTPEWHGYWANPGDAGYGMELEWNLPPGWQAGEPQYPVPQRLVINGLMNHVYLGQYAVLVDLALPEGARGAVPLSVRAQWLACTDKICVPEQATLSLQLPVEANKSPDPRFDGWRAAIPPALDREAAFDVRGDMIRLAIPFPADAEIGDPHFFMRTTDVVRYAATQTFARKGNLLIVSIPRNDWAAGPQSIEGILALGTANGIRIVARPGAVPDGGELVAGRAARDLPGLPWLLLAAIAGGLILNVMPCVFPILSLKALSLARAGTDQAHARVEGLAYTAGAVAACVALGAVLLALRSAGEQVGWAFQLQEPGVVVALLVLAVAITANFAGLYEVPSLSFTRSGKPASAFATGLLAAFVATPCTGPFMAAALGAALLLPAVEALALFAALGFGLALPFLLIGLIPALRRMIPKPGRWMDMFRRAMAVPMGLTALALAWLTWSVGGPTFALAALALAAALTVVLILRHQGRRVPMLAALGLGAIALIALPQTFGMSRKAQDGGLIAARPFSEDALAKARSSGNPVFVWFTADWCLTCKVNESVAIEREATKAAFEKAGVIALRGDWTRRDEAIAGFLSSQGAAGVPLYLWYEPGAEAEQLPQVLTPDTLTSLAARPRQAEQARAAARTDR